MQEDTSPHGFCSPAGAQSGVTWWTHYYLFVVFGFLQLAWVAVQVKTHCFKYWYGIFVPSYAFIACWIFLALADRSCFSVLTHSDSAIMLLSQVVATISIVLVVVKLDNPDAYSWGDFWIALAVIWGVVALGVVVAIIVACIKRGVARRKTRIAMETVDEQSFEL